MQGEFQKHIDVAHTILAGQGYKRLKSDYVSSIYFHEKMISNDIRAAEDGSIAMAGKTFFKNVGEGRIQFVLITYGIGDNDVTPMVSGLSVNAADIVASLKSKSNAIGTHKMPTVTLDAFLSDIGTEPVHEFFEGVVRNHPFRSLPFPQLKQ